MSISELVRGVIRSIHPTHSVCGIGKNAQAILGRHLETDTPVGALSPFAQLKEYNGKVLMLGCGLAPNTSMHGVEELSEPFYLYRPEPVEYEIHKKNGDVIRKSYRVHGFRFYGAEQRYVRLANIMDIPSGKVLEATAYLIDAKTMWKLGHEKLLENERYFIDMAE